MNANPIPDLEEVFPLERRQLILDVLRQEGKVVAADLTGRLKVSVDTIRR
jgi:DeoR/GlpR family transcriptional regulator of sugar metabolism